MNCRTLLDIFKNFFFSIFSNPIHIICWQQQKEITALNYVDQKYEVKFLCQSMQGAHIIHPKKHENKGQQLIFISIPKPLSPRLSMCDMKLRNS
jgi:hypothetical protein